MTVQKPGKVVKALYIMIGTLALGAVNAVAGYGLLRRKISSMYLYDAVLPVTLAVVFLVIAYLIYKLWHGHGAARWVYLALFVAGLYHTLDALLTPSTGTFQRLVILVQTVADITVLSLLFARESTDWFKAMAEERMRKRFR
jgi:hypothetical protein